MENISVKVLIIGGGPSGSACGITLQKAGVNCCIVDKAKFPRVKLCAGLFTHKSQKCLLDILGAEDYQKAMSKVRVSKEKDFALWLRNKNLINCDQPQTAKILGVPKDGTGWDGYINLIDRPAFDDYLINYYKSLGGQIIEGDGLCSIDFDQHIATLSSGQTICYQNLVAADGAVSRIEHLLAKHDTAFRPKEASNAACIEINVDREDLDQQGVNIYFDIVPKSYAWLFSKGEKVCLGLLKLDGEDFDIKEAMTDFCQMLQLKHLEKYPFKGAMIPFGNYMKEPLWKDHVFFVGDAAGLIEPLTAEGIFYALQSGYDAACSLAEGKNKNYLQRVKVLHAIIRKGIQCQKLLENPRTADFLFTHAPLNRRFITYFYHTQIEQRSTDAFWKTCLKYKLRYKKQLLAEKT